MSKIYKEQPKSSKAEPTIIKFLWWRVFYENHENTILGLVSLTIFLIIWELVPDLGLVKPLFTSSPSRIFSAAQWLFAHGLWNDICVSGIEFGVGFVFAVLIGIPLGIYLGWYRRLYAICDPFISTFYATPRIALLPLLILWLGIGIQSKIVVVFLGAIFPILINVLSGTRNIDQNLLKCARSFGASDRQIFTTLAIPNSVPFIIAGMRLAIGRGLIGVVVGELVASTVGIGHMMRMAGATFQTDKVFVGIILLASTGYILNKLLERLEASFEKWRPRDNG